MRNRVDRRYAVLLGIVLSLWAVTNDLALIPPDLGGRAADPPAPEVREAPVVTTAGSPGPSAPGLG